tara:strand:- start:308 stop:640 length:333 start_codon:yes stop_codon:yes gene_type:complete
MILSKKNLGKLNKLKKNKNFINDNNNISNYTKINKIDNSTRNLLKSNDPKNIFYSLIDNSATLEETTEVNHLLRKSEINQINMNSSKADYSKKLTTEDELYDEFNYLLDD